MRQFAEKIISAIATSIWLDIYLFWIESAWKATKPSVYIYPRRQKIYSNWKLRKLDFRLSAIPLLSLFPEKRSQPRVAS